VAASAVSNVNTERRYLFHYIVSDGYVYLCMADEDFPRRIAFAFLDDMKQRFASQCGDRAEGATAYSLNNEFGKVCAFATAFSVNRTANA
jgi:vesicle-associated membrane protein 7